jgi:hypothetical protein
MPVPGRACLLPEAGDRLPVEEVFEDSVPLGLELLEVLPQRHGVPLRRVRHHVLSNICSLAIERAARRATRRAVTRAQGSIVKS